MNAMRKVSSEFEQVLENQFYEHELVKELNYKRNSVVVVLFDDTEFQEPISEGIALAYIRLLGKIRTNYECHKQK